MRLHVVGLSHRTAPIELRECVDFARGGIDVALKALSVRGVAQESVILSTCNRAEVYAIIESDTATETIGRFFSEYHQLDHQETAEHLYTLNGGEAARHLFRVTAGLDSLVVGEPQILGQVKSAYTVASDLQLTGSILNRLFHSSFAVGKRVRSETGLGEGAVSVSYAAIALAKKIFGKLSGLGVLILGAGEMAKLTAIHLKAQNVRQMTIASRTLKAAEGLAARLDAKAVPWTDLDRALMSADIVVTATGATEPVLTGPRVDEVMRQRRNRPLFIIDIAVPRDVDAAVGDLEQVFLYNIDDLQSIVKENLARRTGELERAEAIVTRGSHTLHVVGAVRGTSSRRSSRCEQRFEAIRQSELLRLEPKLAGLPPEARARIDEITRLIVEKLLLTPTEQLKAVSDETTVVAYADALNRLFRLAAEEQARAAADPDGASKVGRR